jgi:hypothetical protein
MRVAPPFDGISIRIRQITPRMASATTRIFSGSNELELSFLVLKRWHSVATHQGDLALRVVWISLKPAGKAACYPLQTWAAYLLWRRAMSLIIAVTTA